MMATFFYRQKHSRRRLAALNFLSNISLDGSLQDAKFDSCKSTLLCDSILKDGDHNEVAQGKDDHRSLCDNDAKIEECCEVRVVEILKYCNLY